MKRELLHNQTSGSLSSILMLLLLFVNTLELMAQDKKVFYPQRKANPAILDGWQTFPLLMIKL